MKEEELTLGEKLYCVLEDLKDFNMHQEPNTKEEQEIEWIITQIENIKDIITKKGLNEIQ